MKPKLFIKGNPVSLQVWLESSETKKYEKIPFSSNGVIAVTIYIGEQCITDEGVTVDFNNDAGELRINRNDFDIAPGEYELTIWIIDANHQEPGQLLAHPMNGNDTRVVVLVP